MASGMKRRYADKSNVLLVNITRLGDMLQATPTIAGIKQENPACKVTVLVEKQFEGICHWLPNIDEVLTIDLGTTVRALARGGKGIVEAYELVDELVADLRRRNFDYCLNMSSSAYTALLLRLVGVPRHGGWTADEEGHRVIESDWAKLFATSVFHQNRQFNSINLVDVFRCSADVEAHPQQLQVIIDPEARERMQKLITEAAYTNTGPLIAIQAGASQGKRQWAPARFIELIRELLDTSNARIVLTGTSKELAIIEPIAEGVDSPNVCIAAGRTNIAELAALLDLADVLVTGDTGPMHISAATGTPVVAMFLASAYGFETGPYGAGHLVLQPVISCGPCNPNKSCARPDCHDQIDPLLVAQLVEWRLNGMEAPMPAADSSQVIVYRSAFDAFGFCDLEPLNGTDGDWRFSYREAYRKLWLNDIAGYAVPVPEKKVGALSVASTIAGLEEILEAAQKGEKEIDTLVSLVRDPKSPVDSLKRVNQSLTDIDRMIEHTGYHFAHLGPLTRMFLFAKENIVGTDAISLASQMKEHYKRLAERCYKLSSYYQ